jgi:hypothetical protein
MMRMRSPPRFRTVPIPRILGLNEDENPLSLAPGELTKSRNVYRRGKTKGTRPGLRRDPDTYTASMTGPVQGMRQLVRNNAATRQLVLVENGTIKATTAGNLNGALTLNPSAAWTFAEFNDVLYGAGGTLDDDHWSWDGVAASVTARAILNLSSTPIYPAYVFEKWNRLFTAGFRLGSGVIATDVSSSPTTVRYTPIGQPTVWPAENTIGGTSTIGGIAAYGDTYLTGFGEFTDGSGDWLLLLTNKKIYAVSPSGDPLGPFVVSEKGTIANGCVHQHAFVSLGLDSGDAIYLSDRGIHSIRQSQQFGARSETFLSWKIRTTFDTINRAEIHKSVGAYDSDRGVVIFFVPTGSNTSPNLGLVLDVKEKADLSSENAEWDLWYPGGSGNDALMTALVAAKDSTGRSFVYAGSAGGDVGRFDPAVSSDFGAGYHVAMRTKHEDYGEAAFEKQPGNIYLTLHPGGSYTPRMRILYDYGTRGSSSYLLEMPSPGDLWGSTFMWGSSVWGSGETTVQEKLYGEGAGQTIAFEFEHATANEPFFIGSVSPEIAVLGDQTPGAGSQ